MTIEGPEFINARPAAVKDFLKSRRIRKVNVSPADIRMMNRGERLALKFTGFSGDEFPIRKTFLHKLLKWYAFPAAQISRLSVESIASVCNDYLLQIKSPVVTIKLENDEALTIVSSGYNEISDLEVLDMLGEIKIENISRNDFMMRIIAGENFISAPVPGDDFRIDVSIINSETGFRALSVSHFLLRLICKNGASVKVNSGSGKKIHYGGRSDEMQKFLQDHLAAAKANRRKIKEKIARLMKSKTEPGNAAIKNIQWILGSNKVNLAEPMNLFDFFNEVTEKAKEFDLSRRVYLEELAGGLIEG